MLSELLANGFAHAFDGRERGHIEVRFEKIGDDQARLMVEDDGLGLPDGSNWPYGSSTIAQQREEAETAKEALDTTSGGRTSGLGGTIVRGLTTELDAHLDVQKKETGTRIVVSLKTG